jgi:hypothetical protein
MTNKRKLIAEYYRCFHDRDLEGLRALLTPDFRHTSSYAIYSNRDAMLAEIWPAVGKSWARDFQIIGGGSEFVARFVVGSNEKPPVRLAEYIRLEGEKIAEVETYVGRAAD